MKKKAGLYLMTGLYLLAGVNHFRNPGFYYTIIPPYMGNVVLINRVSGALEIMLAVSLLYKSTRIWACYGIVLMLLAFIPAHMYMLQADFPVNGQNTPRWILWVRLIVVQPLLILWAWNLRTLTAGHIKKHPLRDAQII
jgi:uncharacterized membrane protein